LQNEDASSSSSVYVGTGPARDLTVERLVEADQISQLRSGDNSLQFIRVENSNSNVPETFRVSSFTFNSSTICVTQYASTLLSFDLLQGVVKSVCAMMNKQIYQSLDFSRRLPHFLKLEIDDQINLIKQGWNELLILNVAYLSIPVRISFYN
jgi:hypothetical protein